MAELALLCALLIAPEALAETAATTLGVSSPLVGFGEPVVVSGSVNGDPGCSSGREVTPWWRGRLVRVRDRGDRLERGRRHVLVRTVPLPHGQVSRDDRRDPDCPAATSDEASSASGRRRRGARGRLDRGGRRGARHGVAAALEARPGRRGAAADPEGGSPSIGRRSTRTRRRRPNPASASRTSASSVCGRGGSRRTRRTRPARRRSSGSRSRSRHGWRRSTTRSGAARCRSRSARRTRTCTGTAPTSAGRPASNTQLLLSMAMLDTLGPAFRCGRSQRRRASPRTASSTGSGSWGAAIRSSAAGSSPRCARAGRGGAHPRDGPRPGEHLLLQTRLGRPRLERRGPRLREPSDRAHLPAQFGPRPERDAAGVLAAELEELGSGCAGTPGAGSPRRTCRRSRPSSPPRSSSS